MKYVYAFNGMVFLKIIVTFGTFLVENVIWCCELAGPLPLMAFCSVDGRWQMSGQPWLISEKAPRMCLPLFVTILKPTRETWGCDPSS